MPLVPFINPDQNMYYKGFKINTNFIYMTFITGVNTQSLLYVHVNAKWMLLSIASSSIICYYNENNVLKHFCSGCPESPLSKHHWETNTESKRHKNQRIPSEKWGLIENVFKKKVCSELFLHSQKTFYNLDVFKVIEFMVYIHRNQNLQHMTNEI